MSRFKYRSYCRRVASPPFGPSLLPSFLPQQLEDWSGLDRIVWIWKDCSAAAHSTAA